MLELLSCRMTILGIVKSEEAIRGALEESARSEQLAVP
jgi:hypothetical protein